MTNKQQVVAGHLLSVFLYSLEVLIREVIGKEEAEDRYGPVGCGVFFENNTFSMRFNGSFIGNQSPNFAYFTKGERIIEINWDRTYLHGHEVVISTELSELELINMFIDCCLSLKEEVYG